MKRFPALPVLLSRANVRHRTFRGPREGVALPLKSAGENTMLLQEPMPRFGIVQSADHKWNWHRRGPGGEIVDKSAAGFYSLHDCLTDATANGFDPAADTLS
jgi:hypothetical protein